MAEELKKKWVQSVSLLSMRFVVLTVALLKIQTLWDVTPCRLVHCSQCFKRLWCLNHQEASSPRRLYLDILTSEAEGATKSGTFHPVTQRHTSQKTSILMLLLTKNLS
jgi:hypothetical protein